MRPPLSSPPLPGPGQARRRRGGWGATGDSGEPGASPTRPRVGPIPLPLFLCPPRLGPGLNFEWGLWECGRRYAFIPSTRIRGHAWRRPLRRAQGKGNCSLKPSAPTWAVRKLLGKEGVSSPELCLPLGLSSSPCLLSLSPSLSLSACLPVSRLSSVLLSSSVSLSSVLAACLSVQPLPPRLFVSPQDSAPLCLYPPWSL